MKNINSNIKKVLIEISEAAVGCGRASDDVKLVAVSKKHPIKKIIQAVSAGQKIFAENYVQEFVGKYDQLTNIEWHFIGSLQSKKVKDIVGKVQLIHSVDRVKLLAEINKRAAEKSMIQKILVQINIAKESSKAGIDEEELDALMRTLVNFPNVKCLGFMIMPPLFDEPNEVRPIYKKAKQLLVKYKLTELSMGTSYDYAIAVEEGATFIRVGTYIFGSR